MFEMDQQVDHEIFGKGHISFIGGVKTDKNDHKEYVTLVVTFDIRGPRKVRYWISDPDPALILVGAPEVAEAPQAEEVVEIPQAEEVVETLTRDWEGPPYAQLWQGHIIDNTRKLTTRLDRAVRTHHLQWQTVTTAGQHYEFGATHSWDHIKNMVDTLQETAGQNWIKRMANQCRIMIELLSDEQGNCHFPANLRVETTLVMYSVLEYLVNVHDLHPDFSENGWVDDAKTLDLGLMKIRRLNPEIIE